MKEVRYDFDECATVESILFLLNINKDITTYLLDLYRMLYYADRRSLKKTGHMITQAQYEVYPEDDYDPAILHSKEIERVINKYNNIYWVKQIDQYCNDIITPLYKMEPWFTSNFERKTLTKARNAKWPYKGELGTKYKELTKAGVVTFYDMITAIYDKEDVEDLIYQATCHNNMINILGAQRPVFSEIATRYKLLTEFK